MPQGYNLIDSAKSSRLQYATVFICFLINILDGVDVLVISYCAPVIATEWNIGSEALGVVFSAALAGMMIGAMFLAPFADYIGRKKIILISALVIGISMMMTATSTSITSLLIYRLLSGLGIGAMLASTTALTAEYTPDKSRDFWVSIVAAGYPVGAVLAGLVAAQIVPNYGWQNMFKLAGIATLTTVPLIWFFLSESMEFYLKKQPANAIQKINTILSKIGGDPINELPEKTAVQLGIPVNKLLAPEYRKPTLQLWLTFFLVFASLYFLMSWIPKLVSDAGLSMSLAIYAGTVFNLGGVVGIVAQGYLSIRFGLKKTIAAFLIAAALFMISFGAFIGSDAILVIFALIGFTLEGGFVGLYAVSSRMYPADFRATGVGWGLGLGRLGAVFGPALGGILVGMGLSISANFLIFAIPTILAGVVILFLSSNRIA